VNPFGETPLTNAVRIGHTECVRMLLENGADPNRTDKGGHSPLLWACYYYHIKIIKSVLEKTEVDADNELYTIYSNIFKKNPHQMRIAASLLESPQDIKDSGDIGIGFQIIASSANFDKWGASPSILNDATVRCLMKKEVDEDLLHQILKNALIYRFDEIKDEVIDMLLEAGAKRFI
jgi:ankyrin repeat protein